jgi:hypothetical protein
VEVIHPTFLAFLSMKCKIPLCPFNTSFGDLNPYRFVASRHTELLLLLFLKVKYPTFLQIVSILNHLSTIVIKGVLFSTIIFMATNKRINDLDGRSKSIVFCLNCMYVKLELSL